MTEADNLNSSILDDPRYCDFKELGAGGRGKVYGAFDGTLKRHVAIKVLSQRDASADQIVRFQREAKIASQLRHINIVSVFDFGITEKRELYLIMDLVEGISLEERIAASGPLPVHVALEVFKQVCDAMMHAHSKGVIHRDLKPSNIMLVEQDDEFPGVRVVDFGLARQQAGDLRVTSTGKAVGTPLFVSPELIRGEEADPRTDVYSFGCLMFATLTGKPPFQGSTSLDTFDMHLHEEPPSLSEYGLSDPSIGELEEIVGRSLNKDPDERYSSFAALELEIDRLISNTISTADLSMDTDADCSVENEIRQRSSTIGLKATIALIAMVLLATAATLLIVNNSQQQPAARRVDLNSPGISATRDEWRFYKTMKDGVPTWHNIDCRMSDEHFKMLKGKGARQIKLYAMRMKGHGLKYLVDEPLQVLCMPEAKITDDNLHYIGQFKHLKHLDLSYTWISDKGLATIGELPDLTTLKIAGCKNVTTGCLPQLAESFPNLTFLDLQYTLRHEDGYSALAQFKHLNMLSLAKSNLVDSDLIPILSLPVTVLELKNNRGLTDLTARRLVSMNQLTDLDLEGCGMSREAILELGEKLPGCRIEFEKEDGKLKNNSKAAKFFKLLQDAEQ